MGKTNALTFKSEEHYGALHEIYEIAADLVAGNGGPAKYRITPTDQKLLMPGYAKTRLTVGVVAEPYGPVAAICLTGFILYGFTFEDAYAKVGITGDLRGAYDALGERFGPRERIALGEREGRAALAAPELATALEGPRSSRLITLTLAKPGARPLAHADAPTRQALATPDRIELPDLAGVVSPRQSGRN